MVQRALPNAINANAPGASQPGMGSGNVPFAPGMTGGSFGGPPPPTARMVGGANPPPMRPGPGNPGHPAGPGGNIGAGPPPGGPPPGMPAGMPGSGNVFDPMLMFSMVQVYFDALLNAANSGKDGFH